MNRDYEIVMFVCLGGRVSKGSARQCKLCPPFGIWEFVILFRI
jgi:hypothetical protein